MKKKEQMLFEQGRQAIEAANFHTAIETFEKFIAKEDRHSQAWFYLGLSYLESGYIQQAMEALNKVLELDAQHADAHYMLGMAMSACGEIDRAAEYYQTALAIDPQHRKAEEVLIRTRALIESRRHYRNAMKIMSGTERKNGWVTQAMRELVQSVAIFSSSPARANLATCVTEMLNASKETSRPINTAEPDRIEDRYCIEGYQALQRQDWPAAIAAYTKALPHRDSDPTTHNALGVALFRSGDPDSAVKAWLRVMELDPEFDFLRLRSS